MVLRVRSGSLPLLPFLLVACAHAPPAQQADPVEQARMLLSELVAADGTSLCAARMVDGQRLERVLAANPNAITDRDRRYYGGRGDPSEGMNLSQASAQMSQAYESARQADAQVRAGVPGAFLRSEWARSDFDAHAAAASRSRGWKPATSDTDAWAALQMATVWTDYFGMEPGADRDELLDWLTSRSLQNPDVLEDYHADFRRAREGCGREGGTP